MDLNSLLKSVTDRSTAFDFLSRRLKDLEESLSNADLSQLSVVDRFDLYKTLASLQISYMDTLRRFLSQVDLDEVLRSVGVGVLAERLKNLSPKSISRISSVLSDCESDNNGSNEV